MSDPIADMPLPEPTPKDEELALEFIRVKDETNLRGTPEGDQRCRNCHFYHDADQAISYCWHDALEIMVGGSWWCDRWEQVGEPDEEESTEEEKTAMTLYVDTVADQRWVAEPRFGEQCNTCLYYLNPDDSVSYCWHPRLQVGVGFDHRCQWWEELPGGG